MRGFQKATLDAMKMEEKAVGDQLSVPNPRQQVSVLVVDDADVIRKTPSNLLKGEPAIKLLGEASNFAEPQWSGQKRPTVVRSKPANGCGPGLRCCTLPFAFRASLISEISKWGAISSSKLEKISFTGP
jgi:hypothetical protein